MTIIKVARTIGNVVRMAPLVFVSCVLLITACVIGFLIDFGRFAPDRAALFVLLLGGCATLVFFARAQFSGRKVEWSQTSQADERIWILASSIFFLTVCWVTAMIVAQHYSSTRTSLMEVLGLTVATALVVAAIALLRSRSRW